MVNYRSHSATVTRIILRTRLQNVFSYYFLMIYNKLDIGDISTLDKKNISRKTIIIF